MTITDKIKSVARYLAIALAGLTTSAAQADITDGKFGTNQIFDVQYYWSGNTLNASNFIAPYDMNFQHPTLVTGQYFRFFNSTTNPGTYGLGLYNADGTLAQVVHNTGTLQAIGPDALFYVGSGFFGTVITTGAGYSYGQGASFTNMDTSVSTSDASSYTWASTTPLGAGQTATSTPTGPTVVSVGPGTPIVTETSVNGTPVITSVTNTSQVNGVDANGNPTVTTYFTVTSTTVTPTTTTTVTTPVTVTTYSDGTTTTASGTPVTTTTNTTTTSTNTTQPAVQSVATTTTEAQPTIYVVSNVYGDPTVSTFVNYSKLSQAGSIVTINRNTTTITAQPVTVTTIGTTPVLFTTTTVDGNGVKIDERTNTITQTVSTTEEKTVYTMDAKNDQASANIGGMSDAIKLSRTNPFLIDPLAPRSDNWISSGMKYYSAGSGSYTGGSIQVGKQMTGSDGMMGMAFEASTAQGSGYLNSDPSVNGSYSGTIYALYKGDPLWFKAAIGAGFSEPGTTTKIPEFGLINSSKAKQSNFYTDLGVYSSRTFAGFRPLLGMTIVNSRISDYREAGTPLLSPMMPKYNTTQINPYVGVRYEFDRDIGIETRLTQTRDFGTVAGARVTAKKDLTKNISINASVGADFGRDYTGAVGTIGLNVKF